MLVAQELLVMQVLQAGLTEVAQLRVALALDIALVLVVGHLISELQQMLQRDWSLRQVVVG